MQQEITNANLLHIILRAILDVVARRSSDTYAVVSISTVLKKLQDKHPLFSYVTINKSDYEQAVRRVTISPQVNQLPLEKTTHAINDLIIAITQAIGKAADYYFLRELKDDIGYEYETILKELGIDLDFMQNQYLINRKQTLTPTITNHNLLNRIFTSMYTLLEDEIGQAHALELLNELLQRLSTKYTYFQLVTLNDIHFNQKDNLVTISQEINQLSSSELAEGINRFLRDINNSLEHTQPSSNIVEQLKNKLTDLYVQKLEEMGVNLTVVMQMKHQLIFKHVIKALISVLSRASTPSYAVLAIDNIIKKIHNKYAFLDYIQIDNTRYSDGIDAVSIMTKIEDISPTQAGRSIQKLIEEVIKHLGEEAGQNFVDEFKSLLGKDYLIRIEEMGVNLHMVELRQNLMW